MFVSSVLAFIISNSYYHFFLKPANDRKVTEISHEIHDFYTNNPSIAIEDYLSNIGTLGFQLYLVKENGEGTFFGGEFRGTSLEDHVIKDVLNGKEYHGIKQFTPKLFVTGFFDNELINTIGIPIEIDDQPHALFIRPNVEVAFGEMRFFFAVLLILIIVISIIFVGVSTRYIVKPITKLTDATKTLSKGKFNIALNLKRRDEIGVLARNFSQMAKNLEQLEEMRQEFVSNVSHEIQSPLASIQGFAQTLQSKELSEEQRQSYLSIIEDESRRMSLLSKQLLTLASLDKEENILEKDYFDVSEQIKQILFMIEYSWRQKEIAIDMQLSPTFIYADQKLLHQVWTNLLTNSIKFTDYGGTISIHIYQDGDKCHIEVKDSGIGISEKDLAHIFTRFYKVDKARSRKDGSSGLGLAITKKIIDLHDGEIMVESVFGKGSTFHVFLPM